MLGLLPFAALTALAGAKPMAAPPFPVDLQPRDACSGNTADDRSTWCDYSTSTDYYNVVPDNGVTREYYFTVTDTTLAPDGYSRYVMTINGSIPGPTIYADWGDTVVVHVTNALTESVNGSTIHFHGIRQNYTNQMDGVPSVTQCPTAVGQTTTYTWRAVQYGTTWYHSHFAMQAWEGVFGGIVINGPATANYDTDAGVVFLTDWSHQTSSQLFISDENSGPPTLDNGLINGTNVFGDDGSSSQTGSRFEMSVVEGDTYRLRLVNGAIDTHWKFWIDNHTMTVMSSDLVPIQPYEATVINIGIGQRYDVVVTFNESDIATDFWMRAVPQVACSDNDSADNIRGIIHYGASSGTPNTTGYAYTDGCADETANLVPYLSKTVGTETETEEEAVTVAKVNGLFRWELNSTTFVSEWDDPTLLQVYNNATSYNTSEAVIQLPNADEWFYLVITTTFPVPHPIHLHGFDFYVLAQAAGAYSDSTTLNLDNPPRRDVAMLPAQGYLVLAFETDNPGAWLMHCHIGWHTGEGFALQFLVRESEILATVDEGVLQGTCSAWSSYASGDAITQEDSGI